jgi:signal peptidase I
VVGLPGEELEITDKVVYIDGYPLHEDYVSIEDDKTFPQDLSPRDNFGPVYVPEDQYLLLGDKRDMSSDGRFFGFVKREEISGKVVIIYWSRDFSSGVFSNVRWERIGFLLKNAD